MTEAVAFDVVDEVAEALTDSDWLNRVYDALGPPREARVKERLDVEVEVRGGQTYCIRYKDGVLRGKKGFARGEPFLAVSLDEAGWALCKEVLTAAAQGFPDAPLARSQVAKMRGLDASALQELYDVLARLEDAAVDLRIGSVQFSAARGPIEAATRTVTVSLPQNSVSEALAGAGRPENAKIGGDSRLRTEAAAAFSPFLVRRD